MIWGIWCRSYWEETRTNEHKVMNPTTSSGHKSENDIERGLKRAQKLTDVPSRYYRLHSNQDSLSLTYEAYTSASALSHIVVLFLPDSYTSPLRPFQIALAGDAAARISRRMLEVQCEMKATYRKVVFKKLFPKTDKLPLQSLALPCSMKKEKLLGIGCVSPAHMMSPIYLSMITTTTTSCAPSVAAMCICIFCPIALSSSHTTIWLRYNPFDC